MKQFKAKILSNKKIAKDIYKVVLGQSVRIDPSSGQFFNVKISGDDALLLRRPFGYVDYDKNTKLLTIVYQVVGKGTLLLSKKTKGAILDIIGPLGNSFSKPTSGGKKILIGGGVGIAPLYSLAKEIKKVGKSELIVIIGARAKDHLILEEDFKKLGSKTFIATENGSKGFKGFATELVKKISFADSRIYACGPVNMYKAMKRFIGESQFCEVLVEEKMACGFGACQGCVVVTKNGTKLACKDGPVFKLHDLVFE